MSKRLNIKLFAPLDSNTIMVFPHQTVWQYSEGDFIMGASNAGGYEKKYRDFRTICRFISLMIQDNAIVTMERE